MHIWATSLFIVACTWAVNGGLNVFGYLKRKLGFGDWPLDGDLRLPMPDGHRLLGSSTTVGGLVICCFAAAVFCIYTHDIVLGCLPVYAYAGHALGSFIKRRLGKEDGRYVPCVDHIDSVLIVSGILTLFGRMSWIEGILATGIILVFQPLLTYIGYKLGLREQPL